MNLNSEKYRYIFSSKIWDKKKKACLFIMLNPSTADSEKNLNDQTTQKCKRIAEFNKFGSFQIVNLFAFRSSDPIDLNLADDPIGPENDKKILIELKKIKKNGGKVIAAWGDGKGVEKPKLQDRIKEILDVLEKEKIQIWVLGKTRSRNPWHPRNLNCQKPFELTKF